jgi:hypothetical protein
MFPFPTLLALCQALCSAFTLSCHCLWSWLQLRGFTLLFEEEDLELDAPLDTDPEETFPFLNAFSIALSIFFMTFSSIFFTSPSTCIRMHSAMALPFIFLHSSPFRWAKATTGERAIRTVATAKMERVRINIE